MHTYFHWWQGSLQPAGSLDLNLDLNLGLVAPGTTHGLKMH